MKKDIVDHNQRSGSAVGIGDQRAASAEDRAAVEAFIDALEAFIEAKIEYEAAEPEYRRGDRVDAARDRLFDRMMAQIEDRS